jgi:hypothetical protein
MRKTLVGAACIAAVAVALAVVPGIASDHLDAPLVKADGRTDINDTYLFNSPTNPNNVVLAMTVNPGAGVISGTSFDPQAKYIFELDTNGDAVADKNITVDFDRITGDGNGHGNGKPKQKVNVNGPGFRAKGHTGEVLNVDGGPKDRRIGSAIAGTFDDPFFFDLAAFRNGLAFCPGGVGTDFFKGLNTSAIIIEVPKTEVLGATSKIGLWGRTATHDGKQIDRLGRPAIKTVFNHTDADKNAFNAGVPKNDQADFRANIVDTLTSLGNSSGTANALADFLLPDIMTADLSQATVFPNGRGLADDVIDTELNLISGGAVPTDCVPNDSTFQSAFPYFGTAN